MKIQTKFRALGFAALGTIFALLSVPAPLFAAPSGSWADAANRDANWSYKTASGSTNIINNARQFAQFAWLVDQNVANFRNTVNILAGDIDLSAHYWKPAGTGNDRFNGTLTAAPHGAVITGMAINTVNHIPAFSGYYTGLFGQIGDYARIESITLANTFIEIKDFDDSAVYAGAFAGVNHGVIIDCVNRGVVSIGINKNSSGGIYIGGIAGENKNIIARCANYGDIIGLNAQGYIYAGGIAGINDGTILNCLNRGSIKGEIYASVIGSSIYSGGIIGYGSSGKFANCVNYGAITAADLYKNNYSNYAGGIVGRNNSSGSYALNCINHGSVTGTSVEAPIYLGALAGWARMGKVENCYWNRNTANMPGAAAGDGTAYTHSASFGSAPGTFSSSVSVIGKNNSVTTTTTSLLAALNAWVGSPSLDAPKGIPYCRWTLANSPDGYPQLILSEEWMYSGGASSGTISHNVSAWAFNVSRSGANLTITGVSSKPSAASAPPLGDKIKDASGASYKIVGIGANAFANCDVLASIAIPAGVSTIGSRAFDSCVNLKGASIPVGVASIGDYAFLNCGLASLSLPEGLASIGYGAFGACKSLASVAIPASVTSIGAGPFYTCSKLASISVASANTKYTSINGVLFNKNATELIQFPSAKTGAYTIPSTVTAIGELALCDADNLSSLVIPDGVKSIGRYAFLSFGSQSSLVIPSSVTSIGSQAFSLCSRLESVTFYGATPSAGSDLYLDSPSAVTYIFGANAASWNAVASGGPVANGSATWQGRPIRIKDPKTFTIAASASPSAGGSAVGVGPHAEGSICSLEAVAKNGYGFFAWTENGQIVSENASCTFTVTGNRTLTANFSTTGTPFSPVYRFYSPVYKGHFYTISESEKNTLLGNRDWNYESIAYYASTVKMPGMEPLFRFWSANFKGHFYTISESERDTVMRNRDWRYENIAFYVYPSKVSGSTDVYRFWSPRNKHHFYTISASEKDNIIKTLARDWNYENIGFFVPTTAASSANAATPQARGAVDASAISGTLKAAGDRAGGDARDSRAIGASTRNARSASHPILPSEEITLPDEAELYAVGLYDEVCEEIWFLPEAEGGETLRFNLPEWDALFWLLGEPLPPDADASPFMLQLRQESEQP